MATGLAAAGHAAVELVEHQGWLTPLEDGLQQGVARALSVAGRRVRNALYGTWLGHPLHPVLTDVPIGAWTVATTLDVIHAASGRRRHTPGVDRAITVGIAGALAAAAAGLADWHHAQGRPRRTGFVHAALNVTSVGLWAASLALRRRGRVAAGRAMSAAGYLGVLASGYLGGTLVYRYQLGVDHSGPPIEPGRETTLDVHDLAEGQLRRIEINGAAVLVVRHGGRVHAIAERCSHMGGPLSEGRIEGDTVVCPWHASRFALADGRVIDGPATMGQPCYEVHEVGGRLAVRRAA